MVFNDLPESPGQKLAVTVLNVPHSGGEDPGATKSLPPNLWIGGSKKEDVSGAKF